MAKTKMASENDGLQSQAEALARSIDAKAQNIEKMDRARAGLQDKTKDFHVSNELLDSRTAHAISLYGNISNITWDYRAQPGHLAGSK